jgi:ABC-2 type transport system ATP-binding protein
MDDVTALCPRVIVIDLGHIIYDGDLRGLVRRTSPDKRVSFSLTGPVDRDVLERLGKVIEFDGSRVVLQVAQDQLRGAVSHALAELPIADLGIEDPPLEDVLRQLFKRPDDRAEDGRAPASGDS